MAITVHHVADDYVAAKNAFEIPTMWCPGHARVGCHHAEMVLSATQRLMASQQGRLAYRDREPAPCAQLIHHAGISRVLVVDGGYREPMAVNTYGSWCGSRTRGGPKIPGCRRRYKLEARLSHTSSLYLDFCSPQSTLEIVYAPHALPGRTRGQGYFSTYENLSCLEIDSS